MSTLAEHYALCEAALRENDRDRWLACLLAPEAARPHLHALYAFNLVVSRVASQVTQALLGEMRLQFWVDALDGVAQGAVRANPTADALLATIEACGLDRELFRELLQARRFDLYDEPQPDLAALDCYCDLTAGHLFRLAGRIVAGKDASGAAAGPAGRAFALTGLLRALPWIAAEGRIFLPPDLLARHGLDAGSVKARKNSPELRAALAELRARARENLAQTRTALRESTPRPERAAYRLAALPKLFLRQMDRAADPFAPLPEIAQWRRQWALLAGRP